MHLLVFFVLTLGFLPLLHAAPSWLQARACSALLVDDFASATRYSSGQNLLGGWTDDDSTMTTDTVVSGQLSLTGKNSGSYWYTVTNCQNTVTLGFAGISFTVTAPSGTYSFTVELQSSSNSGCSGTYTSSYAQVSGVTGTNKLVEIPFSQFSGLKTNIVAIVFSGLPTGKNFRFDNIKFTCGTSTTSSSSSSTSSSTTSSSTTSTTSTRTSTSTTSSSTSTPTSTAPPLVIDTFPNANSNNLGLWHGADEDSAITATVSGNQLTIKTNGQPYSTDLSYYTLLSNRCFDLTPYRNSYIHIQLTLPSGTDFTVQLQQRNPGCAEDNPRDPETFWEVQASRYKSGNDIYIPVNHFDIVYQRGAAIGLRAFTTSSSVKFTKIELVNTLPSGWVIPEKLPASELFFHCSVPNSFAFGIDDGDQALAQPMMKLIKDAGIRVTFFTVGQALQQSSTNFTNVYKEALTRGHQIALHSWDHPYLASLSETAIESQVTQSRNIVRQNIGIDSKYFRLPYGNSDARVRQTLGKYGMKTIMWDVDIEDWINPNDAAKQLASFKKWVDAGGNLVVSHYLYQATVDAFPAMIAYAKSKGFNIMTIKECMGDTSDETYN